MSQTHTIRLIDDDIRLGLRCQPDSCPLARAMTRDLGVHCEVGLSMAMVNGWTCVSLPKIATDWRRRFDEAILFRSLRIRPITFQITLP